MPVSNVYIVSRETFAGKTALAVGLGRKFARSGYRVGYLKPISSSVKHLENDTVDQDAGFVRRVFGLSDAAEMLNPIPLTAGLVRQILRGEGGDFVTRFQEAYRRASDGRDVVVMEGDSDWTEGCLVGLPVSEIARMTNAKIISVERYHSDLVADSILGMKWWMGDRLLGTVINVVPRRQMEFVTETMVPFLESRGVRVLGVLPEDHSLLSTSVIQLAEQLDGSIICCQENADELVENLMVGAMSVDSALSYFKRRSNKAIITGGDRADIQLAALETSTKCLILTGNLYPNPVVVARAQELGVPLVLVKQDTISAVEALEQVFKRVRFQQERKIEHFESMLGERIDFQTVYNGLGLSLSGDGLQ